MFWSTKCKSGNTDTVASSPLAQNRSYFLELPAELRIEIYEHIARQTIAYKTREIRVKSNVLECSEPLIRVCHQLHDEFRDIFDRARQQATHVTIKATNFSYDQIAPVVGDITAGRFSPTAKFKLSVDINRAFMWPFHDLRLVQAGLLAGGTGSESVWTAQRQCIPYDCTVRFVDDRVERDHWRHLVSQVRPGFVVELGEDNLQIDKVAKAFDVALGEVEVESWTYYSTPEVRSASNNWSDGGIRRVVATSCAPTKRTKPWLKKLYSKTAGRNKKKLSQIDEPSQDEERSYKIEHITHDASHRGLASFDFHLRASSTIPRDGKTLGFQPRPSSVARREGWRAFHIVGAPVMGTDDTA